MKSYTSFFTRRAVTIFGLGLLLPLQVAHAGVWDEIGQFIFTFCATIGSAVLSLGAFVLDTAILMLIVEMGEWFGPDSALGGVVVSIWKLIRDLLNILFIFALIYIGIKTILNSEDSGTRTALGHLIIAALLINFSLFFTQVVVDFTNIVAVQLYNQAFDVSGIADGEVPSIAGAFIENSGIQTMLDQENLDTLNFGNYLLLSFFIFVFFIVAGIIFFLGAILVVTRFIALTAYMMFSPLMFGGMILPQLQGITSKWTEGFVKYSFFGPVYILFLFLSMKTYEALTARLSGAERSFADFSVSNTEITIYFMMMIGLLYMSLKVGDQMSISGAKMTMGAFNRARGAAQGVLYRKTVGAGAGVAVGVYDRLDKAANNDQSSSARRYLARVGSDVLGGESGRSAVVKAKNYGAGGTGREDKEKLDTARDTRANRSLALDKITTSIGAGTKDGATTDDLVTLEQTLSGASSSQIVDLAKDKKGSKQLEAVAHLLSEGQFKAIMDEKELDDAAKAAFGKARSDKTSEKLIAKFEKELKDGSPEKAKIDGIKDEGEKKKAMLGMALTKADLVNIKALDFKDQILKNAQYMTDKQISDWKDLTATQKEMLKEERDKQLKDAIKASDEAVAEIIARFKKPDEIAALPKEVLLHKNAGASLADTAILSKIAEKFDKATRTAIKSNVVEGTANWNQEDIERLSKWFEDDRIGRKFDV